MHEERPPKERLFGMTLSTLLPSGINAGRNDNGIFNSNWRTDFAGSKYNPSPLSLLGPSQSLLLPSTDSKGSSNLMISRKQAAFNLKKKQFKLPGGQFNPLNQPSSTDLPPFGKPSRLSAPIGFLVEYEPNKTLYR